MERHERKDRDGTMKKDREEKKRRETEDDRRIQVHIATLTRTCVRSRESSFSISKETFSVRPKLKAESWKLKDAARVSFNRDIRLLVGKTPTSYYGLFWALPTLWYYNYVVIDKSIRLPSCEPPFCRAQYPRRAAAPRRRRTIRRGMLLVVGIQSLVVAAAADISILLPVRLN